MTVLVQKAILTPNLSCLLSFQIKPCYTLQHTFIWNLVLLSVFSSDRMALVPSKSQRLFTEKYTHKITSMTVQVSISKKNE